MILKKSELEEIKIDLNGNISEQIEELCPKSNNDYKNLYTKIWDDMRDTLYMDEVGQIWLLYYNEWVNGEGQFEYIAKCKL